MPSETIEDEDERERRQRYEDTEREMLGVLEAENVDESTRKRQLVGLFDRFRSEYTQLSVKLRESLRLQRRLMDKCLQMKNELVVCALKIKTTEQVQGDEIKSLVFYRDECEHAWKQSALSQERERDAMRIIDDLKTKVEDLQLQVKAFVAQGVSTSSTRRLHGEISSDQPLSISPLASSHLSSVLHPTVTKVSTSKQLKPRSPSHFAMPSLLSFDEWKMETKVWCPATPLALGGVSRTTATPSKESIRASERHQEISRCVSVPSLYPTPMERVSSPQQQQRTKQPTPTSASRAETAPSFVMQAQNIAQTSPLRRGGTPAIKRRAPRQLPHVQ